ncbi:MAG: efflux transporter outer membrane subunit [Legionellales bacterium]|nr:efflux transporter outer membrane subunit [Legionellales bacterium]
MRILKLLISIPVLLGTNKVNFFGKNKHQITKPSLFLAFLFLTNCSVGPTYEPPVSPMPTTWSISTEQVPPSTLKHAWWREFHDPVLNKLIEQQALFNLSIQATLARVQTARAEYGVAFAQLFPKLSADALPPNGTGFDLTQVLALSASIEPDFFGKQKEKRHRAKASLDAEIALHDFAMLNLHADIATAYVEFREAQTKDKIFQRNLKDNRQVLTLLKGKYKSGLTSYMNIAGQRALISTQLAELEQNRALITMILHKIEQLTGNFPNALAQQLDPYKPVPQMKRKISLGAPSELLRRRPDIIAAERRVAAAHANISVAMANLFPQITLGWLLAWQTQTLASNIFAMQDPESTFFGVFSAPLLNMSLYKIVDLRKREKALAVVEYQMTVLSALHDVATQYDFCEHYQASARHFKDAALQKRLVLKLSKNTYEKGVSDFNTVLRAEEELNHLEMAYLHQVVIYQVAQINLYKSLGGGIYDEEKSQKPSRDHAAL